MTHRATRRDAYSRRRHLVVETNRLYERAHPGDCSSAIPYDHPKGVPGCVVIVAAPGPLELRAMDGDR